MRFLAPRPAPITACLLTLSLVGAGLSCTGCSFGTQPAEPPVAPASDEQGASGEEKALPELAGNAHLRTQGWLDECRGTGFTLGSEEDAAMLDALSLSLEGTDQGGISYAVSLVGLGWQQEQGDGTVAGFVDGQNQVEAVKFWLTGDIVDQADLWYRAHVTGLGWMGWAHNGEPSGSEGLSQGVNALQVMVLEKGATPPEEAETELVDSAYLSQSELQQQLFAGSIALDDPRLQGWKSGDADLDAYIDAFIADHAGTGEDALRNAYEYISYYSYVKENEYPDPNAWQTWSKDYAKEMYANGCGNCYRYASLLCWTARRLGYDAKVIAGEVPWHGVWSPHGWVEITVDGVPYVCDSDMHKFIADRNFFMVTYEEAPIEYRKI